MVGVGTATRILPTCAAMMRNAKSANCFYDKIKIKEARSLTQSDFLLKWHRVVLTERSECHEHFLDYSHDQRGGIFRVVKASPSKGRPIRIEG
jgi:hypothetical protein